MDLQKLTSTLLSSDTLSGLSSLTGSSNKDVSNVLSAALPALLNGAKAQANDASTTEGYANALAQHAKDDTNDLAGFLGNVDLADGAKIVSHLLGSDKGDVTSSVAKKAGVSKDTTSQIMSAAGPLLMSLLGQQADEDDNKDSGVGALLGSLLDNVDLGELLTGQSSSSASSASSSGNGLSGLLGGLLGGLFKK